MPSTSVTIHLEGELDFAAAFDVELRLEEAIREADAVVVDLTGLRFIDSTGLRAILEARRLAQTAGVELRIVPGPPEIQRVFEVTGLLDELPFEPAAG
jgi:anti-anti-sigma factor